MNRFSTFILFFIFFALSLPAGLLAQFGGPSHVQVELVSEVNSVQPGGSFWVATRLNMDHGWHIYWRNPGDTGLETTIDWQLPQGFTAGPINWPYPEAIREEPLVIYGYHGEIYLLTQITAPEKLTSGQSVKLKGTVNWLECADVCVPGQADIELTLPVRNESPAPSEKYLKIFSRARSKLPIQAGDWQFSATIDDRWITIQGVAPQWFDFSLDSVSFFPYQTGLIKYAPPQKFTTSGKTFRLRIERAAELDSLPGRIEGIVVNESGWRGGGSEKAMEVNIPVGPSLTRAAGGEGLDSIWLAILFAFLGGIILNLMPCVLPVLSIKIMGFINQAHDEHAAPWKHGIVFTLGVLASFWALAGALLIFKAGGAQLGWGFQLQSPVFLMLLAAFMFLFGLSMFGVFEIGTSLTTVGGAAQNKSGWMSSFISGVTATIVATPCTAPFMGGALGFALTQPAWVSMLVFTFLGLGMAFPFVLISSVPALLRFVPKPGRWMESLKQFMGFLLVATVIWLLWVLGLQAGSNAVTLVLINLLLTALAAWIYGRWGHLAMPVKTRTISSLIALVILIASNGYALAKIDTVAVNPAQAVSQGEGIAWQEFSEEKVEQSLAQGNPVFIDFTAAWCLSCQVNDQVAFGSEEVQKKFIELGITALKADWTSRDESITRALARFGRNSVPLYVLYDGRGGEPRILPEIITPGIILQALESLNR